MFSMPASRGRRLVPLGALALIGAVQLQWSHVGGGVGQLPARGETGLALGPGFAVFVLAMAILLICSFRLVSPKPLPIDRPIAYLALTAIAAGSLCLAGFELAAIEPGFWLAVAGLAVLAAGVLADFRASRRAGNEDDTADTTETADTAEPAPETADAIGTRYVPAALARLWQSLSRSPDTADRSSSLDAEPAGRLDRIDLWVVAALAIGVLTMRIYGLGQPPKMYFDEVYHARTATEFLQDWRYGIQHDIYEWTHPMLAKYAIATGIVLFDDDRVTETGRLNGNVRDAAVEVDVANAAGSTSGGRLFVATGADVRAYDLRSRQLVHVYAIPNAAALSAPAGSGVVYVGTADGAVYRIDTEAQAATRLDVSTGLSIARIYAGTAPFVLASDRAGHVVSIDTSAGTGRVAGQGDIPGLADFAAFGRSDGGSGASPAVLVACGAGVAVVDARTLSVKSTVPTGSAVTSLAVNPDVVDARDGWTRYHVYATAGDSLAILDETLYSTGEPDSLALSGDQPLMRMPGAVTKAVFDAGTGIVQVVGRAPDGNGWTVYAIESNGNAVFSDARLPFEPVAIGLDNAVSVKGLSQVQQLPGTNREALLAFSPDGSVASVDVGQFAFSWRLVGVFFGALTAVCLYLLARILFRRRSVGLLIALFSMLDGMLFVQSRIAMNDVFVGGFLLLAYLIFAVMWLGVWRHRLVFWLGMPLLGVVLGLALSSKWVAAYAIVSICLLILIRCALGRMVTILGLTAATGVLGWMALAEMKYQPGTGNELLCGAFLVAAAIVGGSGMLWGVRTPALPDRIVVGVVTLSAVGILVGGALLASPAPQSNGAPNITFFLIMLAITCIAAAANVYRPVAWTKEEFRLAVAAPAILGVSGPPLIALLLMPIGLPVTAAGLAVASLLGGVAGLAVGGVVAAAFWAAGRMGLGPLAAAPDRPAAPGLPKPPSPAPEGWLRLGSGFGLPAAWTALCVLVLPFVVYVVMFVPWSMPWQSQGAMGAPGVASGPLPAIACWHTNTETGLCDDAWPAGHTGQTLWGLTIQMYDYHNDLRSPHPASSPWWAWPLDLKPVWFESGGGVQDAFSWIHDGGNPALWWPALFAMGFVSWQAFRRRNLGLGLVAVAFFWQWLSWARIDRAAFQYHFYTALPFYLLALAYFLAELWHGPSRRTWLLARVAAATALLAPGLLWLSKSGLCGLARVDASSYYGATACGSATGDVVITERVLLVAAVTVLLFVALIASFLYAQGSSCGIRSWRWAGIGGAVASCAAGAAVITWVWRNGPDDVLVRTALPSDAITVVPMLAGVLLAGVAITARNPRRFVVGLCLMAGLVFLALYPDLAGTWLPAKIQGIYSAVSPTWMYGFQFSTNLQQSVSVKIVSVGSAGLVLIALLLASLAATVSWQRRVINASRRCGPPADLEE